MFRQMKPRDAPFCLYWDQVDFLDVICGDSPCTSATSWYAGTMVMKGVDVLRKMHAQDFATSGDDFAGIQIWGGVQNFLSHNYKRILVEDYEGYRLEHNAGECTVPVLDIVHFLLEDDRGLV